MAIRQQHTPEPIIGKLSDELLGAKVLIERYRVRYNTVRSHSSWGTGPARSCLNAPAAVPNWDWASGSEFARCLGSSRAALPREISGRSRRSKGRRMRGSTPSISDCRAENERWPGSLAGG